MTNLEQDFNIERRLHPLTIFYRAIISLPAIAFPLYLAISNQDTTEWFYIILAIVFGLIAFPFSFLSYYFFTFLIKNDEIIIKSGVLSRNQRNIPLERVQNVDISQNVIHQLLGIAKVEIQTAGGSNTEGLLEYVSKSDAEEIRNVIRHYQNILEEEKLSEDENDETDQDISIKEEHPYSIPEIKERIKEHTNETEKELYKMSIRELMTYGMLRFRPIVLVGVVVLMQYMNLFPGLIENLDEYVDAKSLEKLDVTMIVLYVFLGLFLTLFLSWIADIALTVNQFYNFRLSLDGNKLQTEYGLLGRRKGTIPLKKLQSMTIASNFITRKLNLFGLRLQTAGLGIKKSTPEVAVPLANIEPVNSLCRNILQYDESIDFTNVSRLTIRRAMFRYMIALLPLMAVGVYFSTWLLTLLLLIPLFYYGAVLRYQYRGYALQGDNVVIKQGFFFQRITIIPIKKIQTLHVVETFFQRRLGLATINVDTAGLQTFSDASIVDIAAEDADTILALLTNAFQEKMQKELKS